MKRMKYLGVVLLLTGMILSSCNSGTKTKGDNNGKSETIKVSELSVDLDASSVVWKGEMLGMYHHEGTVNISSANLEVSDNIVSGGSFTIDMNSITPTDDAYDPEKGRSKENLIGHLSSPDFFDVGNHPESKFRITGVEGSTVKGELSIRGITHEESVENVIISREGKSYIITGDLVFDRTMYDAKFQMTMQDMVLSDDIQLRIKLVAS